MEKVVAALRWTVLEMERRYGLFADVGARNIVAFNDRFPEERLVYLVVVVDELADMMMTAAEDVERLICRLAQLGRAAGVHLVVATQRPSVDVLTGLIKANLPTRIAFAVSSQIDSRVILDRMGAEKLLGRGDALYQAGRRDEPAARPGRARVRRRDRSRVRLLALSRATRSTPPPTKPSSKSSRARRTPKNVCWPRRARS